MTQIFLSLFFIAIFNVAHVFCICKDPEIKATSYTTEDGTVVTNVAFVTEFTLKCSNGVSEIPLYADVSGKMFPAVQLSKDSYQVSWVEEIQKARSGVYSINFYDEEGYALLRKALRNYEQASSVKPLFNIVINHPGTYQGPWLNSEFLAAALAIVVWYLAFTAKSKLLH
uniref:Translocon-associated protein subunit delta n=1 Tax=Panstrongylus lignarius TaxID=156445 RepID=A0A224XMB2_9HEMI